MSVGNSLNSMRTFKKTKNKEKDCGMGVRSEPAEMGVPFSNHSPSFSRSNKSVHLCYLICGCFFFIFFFIFNGNFCPALAIFFFSLVSRNK